ncbi:MAG: phosphomannomutase [Rhizobiaceae bacterium]|nr:phosphomannomutase [Rhizobiaceae bacterium]
MAEETLKFGTSGLRGLSERLAGRPAAAYSAAFASVMMAQGRMVPGGTVLVGRDLRASSPVVARFCFAGLTGEGAEPLDCGELSTPALAARAMKLGLPAIMVTGSHIPEDRNGLKFYRPDGEIDKHDEAAIAVAERTAKLPENVTLADAKGDHGAALDDYRRRATSMLGPGALKVMRIGVYEHSSVMRDLLVEVLSALGAEVVPFGRSDVFVPIDTEALSAADAQICHAAMRQHELDAVVSTDGDADRPLIADENGAFLRGDLLGAMTAAAVGADCVVTPISSNSGIERCGRFAMIKRTRIGSPYVIEGMGIARADGASTIVGFEANGGVLLGSDAQLAGRPLAALPTRDAMLPILAVLWTAKSQGKPLSEFASDYSFAAAKAGRLQGVSAEKSRAFLAAIEADGSFRDALVTGILDVRALDTTDGVRLTGEEGSVLHFRASGNAPELRCYVEAGSEDQAALLLERGLARSRQHLNRL